MPKAQLFLPFEVLQLNLFVHVLSLVTRCKASLRIRVLRTSVQTSIKPTKGIKNRFFFLNRHFEHDAKDTMGA